MKANQDTQRQLLNRYKNMNPDNFLTIRATNTATDADSKVVTFDALGGYQRKNNYSKPAAVTVDSTTTDYQTVLNTLASGYAFFIERIAAEVKSGFEKQFQNPIKVYRDQLAEEAPKPLNSIYLDKARRSTQEQITLVEMDLNRIITVRDALVLTLNRGTVSEANELTLKLSGYLVPQGVVDFLGMSF